MKMMKIEGIDKLNKQLKEMAKGTGAEDVIVGYTQGYAIYVHEVQTTHKEGKQWKYLETPARQLSNSGKLARVISEIMRRSTTNFQKALLTAGLRIQRESMKIVPILTGALRASAFTAKDSDMESKASEALSKSEGIRNRKKNK